MSNQGFTAEEWLFVDDLLTNITFLTTKVKVLEAKLNETKTRVEAHAKEIKAKIKEVKVMLEVQQQKCEEITQRKNKEFKD
jgi:uncharacterized membrane protein